MARPTVIHDGFLVPNALSVSHPRMAEPDQLDFATAANARWGVIEGCLITVSGTTASTLGGTAIVNGVLVAVRQATAAVGVGGPQDRFDLVVTNDAGDIKLIPGAPSVDPVFPDCPLNCTVLAAVFCPTGQASYDSNVVDKRRFVSKALLTKLAAADELIRNVNGTGDHYRVLGDGRTAWGEDTFMFRSAARTLTIQDYLRVAADITALNNIYAKNLIASNTIGGINLSQGDTPPSPAPLGSIFQKTDGRVYVNTATGWQELATLAGAVPVGAVITSVEPPSVMGPLGWVPLAGQVVNEASDPSLFTLTAFTGRHTGVAPNRSMTLPDARQRVLMGTSAQGEVGRVGGNVNNQIALRSDQMPRHRHNVAVQPAGGSAINGRIGRAGSHEHSVVGGEHQHPVTDPGHSHAGGEYPAGSFVCLVWGGRNKIDALFNDRNHTYSVEAVEWSRPAVTGISIGTAGSAHVHNAQANGDHDHPLSIDPIGSHVHGVIETEVGAGAAIDITPSYISLFVYIRS